MMDAYSWQEIIFGVVLFGGLLYGAYRFIAPRLNKGSSGISDKPTLKPRRRPHKK